MRIRLRYRQALAAISVIGIGIASALLSPLTCTMGRICPSPTPIDQKEFRRTYNDTPPRPDKPLAVYHLGHSLVGHDMPSMLAQISGDGHSFASQLGWGAFMRQHWSWHLPVNGFETENAHPQHRDPIEALRSGEYDALVVTEAVEIRDAIEYFSPHYYLRKFATTAWRSNPSTRVFLYETWHELDDEEGWLERIDRDLQLYWEKEILRKTLAFKDVNQPIYVIPAGQVLARFIRAVEKLEGVGPIKDRYSMFHDTIHFNDYGAYLIALTHYATLYGRSPVGLPFELKRADGTPANNPGPQAAKLMQEIVWEVVTNYPPSGVRQIGE